MATKQESRTKGQPLRIDLSLRGRKAWALQVVERIRKEGNTEAIGWILDQWIEGPGRDYLTSYDVDLKGYSKLGDDVYPDDSGNPDS